MSHERLDFTPYEVQRSLALKKAVEALKQCERGEGWLYIERTNGGTQIKLATNGVRSCVFSLWEDLANAGLEDLANRIIGRVRGDKK